MQYQESTSLYIPSTHPSVTPWGAEPDVVGHDKNTGEYIFYDCSAESPKGRRSVCFDREALESRKEHKPEDNAIDMAAAMGIELLTEEQYRELRKSDHFLHHS